MDTQPIIPFWYSKKKEYKKNNSKTGLYQTQSQYKTTMANIDGVYGLIVSGHTWRLGEWDALINPDSGKYSFFDDMMKNVWFIALDFDKCEDTPQSMMDRMCKDGLPGPNFWYWSYSQGTKPKNNFRLVWALDKPWTATKQEFSDRMDYFISLYGADKECKNISRLWWGTWHTDMVPGGIINHDYTSLELFTEFFNNCQIFQKIADGNSNCIYNSSFSCQTPKFGKFDNENSTIAVGTNWTEQLYEYCDLWRMWVDGIRLHHAQRCLLFFNLSHLKVKDHNIKIKDQIWSYYNPNAYVDSSFKTRQQLEAYMDRTKALAPICDVAGVRITVPDLFEKYDFYKQQSSLQDFESLYITTKEIKEEDFDMRTMDETIASEGLQYLEAPTATGKTERVIDWVYSQPLNERKIIYACPTNALAREVYERFKAKEMWSEEVPIYLIPEREYGEIEMDYMELGLNYAGEHKEDERSKAITQMKQKTSVGVYITTHALLTITGKIPNTYRIIVDENIEQALVQKIEMSVAQLETLREYMPNADKYVIDEYIAQLHDISEWNT